MRGIREIFNCSRLMIAAILAITLLYGLLSAFFLNGIIEAAGGEGSGQLVGSVMMLAASGLVLGAASLAATFYIGYSGVKNCSFGYGEAAAAAAISGTLNGALAIIISLLISAIFFGRLSTLPGAAEQGIGAEFGALEAGWTVLSGLLGALGGTVLAILFSLAGAFVAIRFGAKNAMPRADGKNLIVQKAAEETEMKIGEKGMHIQKTAMAAGSRRRRKPVKAKMRKK